MRLLRFGLGDLEGAFDHLQGLVAEDGLQGKDVAAVAQEGDGESAAEAMGGRAPDTPALLPASSSGGWAVPSRTYKPPKALGLPRV